MTKTFNQDKFTPSTNQSLIYSDLFTDFTVHPNIHDLSIKKNEEAVKTALRNLINTNKYERPFNPTFGGNLRNYLFEQISPLTAHSIQDEITNIIENYEPRVRLISVVATPHVDENAYAITITFYVTNNSSPITLSTLLFRVR